MGRKGYQPTAEHTKLVKALATFGIPQAEIADYIGIDAKTLRKHFKVLLHNASDNWKTKLKIHIVQRAFKSDIMAMFLAKTQLGWRESGTPTEDAGRKIEIVFRETAPGERIAKAVDDE